MRPARQLTIAAAVPLVVLAVLIWPAWAVPLAVAYLAARAGLLATDVALVGLGRSNGGGPEVKQ